MRLYFCITILIISATQCFAQTMPTHSSQPATSWITNVLQIGASVGTPLRLIGFAVAACLIGYLVYLRTQQRKLEHLPEQDRIQFALANANRYGLKATDNPLHMAKHIKDEMTRRYRLFTHILYVVAGIVVFSIGVTVAANIWTPQPNPFPQRAPKPTVIAGRTPTGGVQFTLSFNADVIPPQARVEVEVATDSAFNNSWDRQEVREWRSGQVIIGVPSATTSEGYVRLRLLHPDGQLACTGDETRVTIPEATP